MNLSSISSTRRGFVAGTSALAGLSVLEWAATPGAAAAPAEFDLLTQLRADASAGRLSGAIRLARGNLPVATPCERDGAKAFALETNPAGAAGYFAVRPPHGVRAPDNSIVVSLFPDAPAEVAYTAQADGAHEVSIDARLLTPATGGGFRPTLLRRDRHGVAGTVQLGGLVEDRWRAKHLIDLDKGDSFAILLGRGRAIVAPVLVSLSLRIHLSSH